MPEVLHPIPTKPTRMKITPEIAQDWLTNRNSPSNRNLSEYVAARYAKVMTEGRWMPTHQGIAFDSEGWLMDGQHRLRAVVLSGCVVEMFVIPDCDSATFAVLDNGHKRQASHLIKTPEPKTVAAAARILAVVTGVYIGTRTEGGVYDGSMPTDIILDVADSWPELSDMAVASNGPYKYGKINKPMHVAILAQACRTRYVDRIPSWIDGLTHGVGLQANDPRLLLRNRFIRDSAILNGAVDRGATYNLIAKAWNAHAQSRPLGVLKLLDSDGVVRVVG